MNPNPPPRWRSLLFVPAHVTRFIAKANQRGADGVILDLEDAVPPAQKPEARGMLAESIPRIAENGTAAMVRVNHHLRHIGADLEAAIRPGLSALVLPKVEDAGFVRDMADAVAELETERAIPPGTVRFILQIESPAALFSLQSIAGAHPRIAAMTLGPEDYSASMGGLPVPEALLAPNYAVLCAARAAGILPMGFVGSIGEFSDPEAFAEVARQARRLGFRGALVVHPAQVGPLNAAFSPSAAEIDWARRVTAGDRDARARGLGAFQVDGKMIDAPVVRRAEEILSLAG
ncbi:CoA ester lyase [Roseomonas sp. SSH11]|uniref:CoA ester lyase n=1 Tax=Pararoseomonas baculiformis TaxID=2820812 RepID=A0ABS4AL91_9PROT|nr:CoA ester lyase [Pararoseomonas baculiformis]MBP0446964.1 CoA ester lyase [Pararoseomonas baculiformis]